MTINNVFLQAQGTSSPSVVFKPRPAFQKKLKKNYETNKGNMIIFTVHGFTML